MPIYNNDRHIDKVTKNDSVFIRKKGNEAGVWTPVSRLLIEKDPSLSELSDVDLTNLQDGDTIIYDQLTNTWVVQSVGIQEDVSTVFIDYEQEVVINAVWNFGNLQKRISTNATSVTASGINKWHFSPIDTYGTQLDNQSKSLFTEIITASQAANVIFKIYNRNEPSQYVVLVTKESLTKENPSNDLTQYDLSGNMEVVAFNGIINDTIQNPTVDIKIGSSKDVVRYNTDTFTSYNVLKNVVTLSKFEYLNISEKDANTLYLIPCNN